MIFMRLIEIEANIKKLIEEDVNNPEVYNEIQRLAYLYLKRYKKMNKDIEAQEVSHLVASELYYKVVNGGEIYSWLGYMSKTMIWFIRKYRSMTDTQMIDTTEDTQLYEAVLDMSVRSSDKDDKYNEIVDYIAVNDLPNIVNRILERICRYDSESSEYMNIHMSIIMSLITDRFVTVFISEEVEPYCRLMYSIVKDKLTAEVEQLFKSESFEGNYTLMQMLAMEGAD